MKEPQKFQSLGWEEPLEKGMATHSSILVWRIPWTETGGLQSMGLQRVGHDWAAKHTAQHSVLWPRARKSVRVSFHTFWPPRIYSRSSVPWLPTVLATGLIPSKQPSYQCQGLGPGLPSEHHPDHSVQPMGCCSSFLFPSRWCHCWANRVQSMEDGLPH